MSILSKLFYQIALTQITGVGDITARNLLKVVGNEEAIFKSSRKSLLTINGLGNHIVDEILSAQPLRNAEREIAFIEKNKLKTYFITDKDYPQRLSECNDAPILLYHKGNADFNTKKTISIVGTRNSSNYGNNFCDTFLEQFSNIYPDTLIVSGLAYGIDINAHRAALKYNLPTIGILAHGLDRIYPSVHRQTAIEMIERGGLLTEFPSMTEPNKFNFVRRNRIVAGIADAVLVIESNERGGSLITAEIANSYCKDVFALPGRINDLKSVGCNKLIAEHKADLLLSVDYFLKQMGWDEEIIEKKSKTPKQTQLFIDLSADEQKIVDTLTKQENMHIDILSNDAEIPSHTLFSLLLGLEMKGVITCLPGNTYSLC